MGQAWTAVLVWQEIRHGLYSSYPVDRAQTFFAHDYTYEWERPDGTKYRSINGYKLMETSYKGNQLVNDVIKEVIRHSGSPELMVAWVGEYYHGWEDEDQSKLIEIVNGPWEINLRHTPDEQATFEPVVICCDELKQCIRCTPEPGKEGHEIAALPLLCAIGNGAGGGDYSGSNMELVGTWAFKPITVRSEIPEGYEDLTDVFKEEWE